MELLASEVVKRLLASSSSSDHNLIRALFICKIKLIVLGIIIIIVIKKSRNFNQWLSHVLNLRLVYAMTNYSSSASLQKCSVCIPATAEATRRYYSAFVSTEIAVSVNLMMLLLGMFVVLC